MIIKEPGNYRFTRDFANRGTISVGTLKKGRVIEITQVSASTKKVIGPSLADWCYYDMPVEKV